MNTRTRWLLTAGIAALVGFAGGRLAVVLLDLAGPSRTVAAVVSRDERIEHEDSDGLSYEYLSEARTEAGAAISLGHRQELVDRLMYGSPVLVGISRLTGDVVTVRSAHGLVRTTLDGAGLAGLGVEVVLLGAGLVLLRHGRRPAIGTGLAAGPVLLRSGRRRAIGTGLAAGLLVPALLLLDGPGIGSTQAVDDDRGLGIYTDPRFFPATVATGTQPVTVDEITLRATGPAREAAPAGAASWLGGFHVVVVPVEWTHTGPYERGFARIELIGPGAGIAELVPGCAGAPYGFDGTVDTATELPRPGLLCYVVPAGFRPQHLVVGVDPSAAIRLD
jgi:hypothetical protein